MREARPHGDGAVIAGILIVCVGLCVRFPITSLSAMLSDVDHAYTLGTTGLAVLAAIPVLLFGLASPLAPWLVRRLGTEGAIAALLSALALALLLRPLNSITVYAGTVVVGAAIALLGILTPQLIRSRLSAHAGLWTGIYTSTFGVSAAIGAALALPVLGTLGDAVPGALLLWAAPVCAAAGFAVVAAWRLRVGRAATSSTPHHRRHPSILRAPRVWSVTVLFGCQALIYFALTAWLPTIAVDRGVPPVQAGLLLAWLSVAGIPAALFAPMIATRLPSQSVITAVVSLLSAIGLAGLAFAPIEFAVLSVAVLGIAQSAAFGLAVTLIVLKAPSTSRTAAFSAVAQGVGYAIASLGPLGLGILAHSGLGWTTILAGLLGVAVVQGLVGMRAGRAMPASTPHAARGQIQPVATTLNPAQPD